MKTPSGTTQSKVLHRVLWRWHFYAGLFCFPFILWLACTGTIYLFKPQIEAFIDRPYDTLAVTGTRASGEEQIKAALAAIPHSFLSAYELPMSTHSAVRIIVKNEVDTYRVYVHPTTLQILKIVPEDRRFMRLIFQLHGELLMGDRGSMIVELAASWAIVLILTGLYLWWPREVSGLGGVLYPRVSGNQRQFLRDLHAVTGVWVSFFALFLLVSGLPWARSWGGILKEIRSFGHADVVKQDWTTSHEEHMAHHAHNTSDSIAVNYGVIDKLITAIVPLNLAPPILISPPTATVRAWTARSDAQNRPLRATLTFDPDGTIVKRENFSDRPLLDRIIGTGVAAHEGQLFGWPNQLLGLITAAGLITLSISAVVMWWRRRPSGTIGAPKLSPNMRSPRWLIATIVILGVLLPLLGVSLIVMYLCEHFILRRIQATRIFLGLKPYCS